MLDWLESIPVNVVYTLIGIYSLLLLSTLTIRLPKFSRNKELRDRVKAWWFMVAIFSLALVISKTISIVFFAILSFMALKEFFSMVPTRRADRRVLFWAYFSIPLQYYWVAAAWYGMFIIFIPVYLFLFLPLRMIVVGETKDFLKAVGTIHWGTMLTVFGLSHLAFLFVLPEYEWSVGGNAGLVLFLVLLTEINDVNQYVSGKLFGKHKIVPTVSPNKTWQGFIGGLIITTVLAALIAPILTPFTLTQALVAGLLIASCGFVGDVVISAVKRDIGVKDLGNIIPGHGGILDRLDSLLYTAPLFFHYIYYLHY